MKACSARSWWPDGTQGVKVNDPIAILVEEGEAVPVNVAAPAVKAARRTGTARTRARAGRPYRRAGAATGAGARVRRQPARRGERLRLLRRCSKQPPGAWRQRPRCRWRADLRVAAGPPHGAAGGHRSARAEGQRPERPHRQGGHRSGDAARPRRAGAWRRAAARRGAAAARAAGRSRHRAGDHRAAQAGAAQQHAEGHRPPADRGEVHDPAFLRVDGHRDRRR